MSLKHHATISPLVYPIYSTFPSSDASILETGDLTISNRANIYTVIMFQRAITPSLLLLSILLSLFQGKGTSDVISASW